MRLRTEKGFQLYENFSVANDNKQPYSFSVERHTETANMHAWVKDDKFYIAGHNVQFDLDFCKLLFQKQGDKYFFSYFKHQTVDLMSLATILHTANLIYTKSFKLEDIAKCLNIECNKELHDASVDIDITRKCFCKLVSRFVRFDESE